MSADDAAAPMPAAKYFDADLRVAEIKGNSQIEVFNNVAQWLARNDGALIVVDVTWRVYENGDDPWMLMIYFYPDGNGDVT